VEIIVDNEAAKENVSRYLSSRGLRIEETVQEGNLWKIFAVGQEKASDAPQPDPVTASTVAPKTLVFLTSDVVGRGDDMLGQRLMDNFLRTLPELGDDLWRIVMVNGAVRLAVKSSPALPHLLALEAAGVSILVCGTCLEFFGLMEQKGVGQTTNMLDVVTSQQLADKIITI
jgi:selenium metabolism protein YedF